MHHGVLGLAKKSESLGRYTQNRTTDCLHPAQTNKHLILTCLSPKEYAPYNSPFTPPDSTLTLTSQPPSLYTRMTSPTTPIPTRANTDPRHT